MAEATFDTGAPTAGAAVVQSGVQMADTLIGNAQARALAQRQQSFSEMVHMKQLAQADRAAAQADVALSMDQQRMNLERQKFTSARNDVKRVLSAFGGVPVGDAQAAQIAVSLKALDFNKQQQLKATEQAAVLRQELLRASDIPSASERLASLRTAVAANPLGFDQLNSREQQQFLEVGKQSQAASAQEAYADILAANTIEDYQKAVKKHTIAIASSPVLSNLYQTRYTVLSMNARTADTNQAGIAKAEIAAARKATSGLSFNQLLARYVDKTGVSDNGSPMWYYRIPGVANPILAFDGQKYYDLDGRECSPIEMEDILRTQAANDATFQDRQPESPAIYAPPPDLNVYGGAKIQAAATIDNTYLAMLNKSPAGTTTK